MAADYAALKAGGFMRQKQKDMFSMRLRVVGGTVTVQQLKAIAEAAEKFGHNYVHLTSRQGVEIPFIRLEEIDEVKDFLAASGVQPGVCGPRVRTVTACQGGRCCPSGCIDALEIAEELDRRYFGRQLPHKFKFGVTGCQNNCLKAEEEPGRLYFLRCVRKSLPARRHLDCGRGNPRRPGPVQSLRPLRDCLSDRCLEGQRRFPGLLWRDLWK